VKDHVHQMEAESARSENLIAKQISHIHQGPIKIRHLRDVRSGLTREDFGQVVNIADLGVLQHLCLVVSNEAVAQRIQIGQGRTDDEEGNQGHVRKA